jgi:predicted Ser/Thr protein kinase
MAAGTQENRIYLFEGPHGSGKSKFLSILIKKLEEYSRMPEGTRYETVWRFKMPENHKNDVHEFNVVCPNHDNPILMIPKKERREFLSDIIESPYLKMMLFNNKEYEWVFKKESCSVCSAIFDALYRKYGNIKQVLSHLWAQKYVFDKKIGKGITVYNPADTVVKMQEKTNSEIQKLLNIYFQDAESVFYLFSEYAYINDGMYCLMDLKLNNEVRLRNLHSIVTDKIHKVSRIEESIESLFIGVLNPEDEKAFQSMESFKDRIISLNTPYILNYEKELKLYHVKFGQNLTEDFLPGIVTSLAKIIVSSRLKIATLQSLYNFMKDKKSEYKDFLDANMLTLRTELYSDRFPNWIKPEHKNKVKPNFFKQLFDESRTHKEGFFGISGRKSLNIMNDLVNISTRQKEKYRRYIDMDVLIERLKEEKEINVNVLNAFRNIYDFNVTQTVKTGIFQYREKMIENDIKNYLFGISQAVGFKGKNPFTQEVIKVTDEWINDLEKKISGLSDKKELLEFRNQNLNLFSAVTLTHDIHLKKKKLEETKQFVDLQSNYVNLLRKDVFQHIGSPDKIKRAIETFGTEEFKIYDERIQIAVTKLLENLQKDKEYQRDGAIQISLYVINHELYKKY